MKKYTGSFNKFNHVSNNLKIKSILSIFTMGIFIFFGFASIDEGDPTLTELYDCDFLHPPVSVVQTFLFDAVDENGDLLVNAKLSVKFDIKEYEKKDDQSQCTIVLKNSYSKTLNFVSGRASLTLSKSYLSKDDVILISSNPSLAGYNADPYSNRVKASWGSSFYERIKFLKIDQYP